MTVGKSAVRLLYIASAGIRDPLIQSQVVGYLSRLAPQCERCVLLTYEREPVPGDLRSSHLHALAASGIQWLPIEAQGAWRLLNIWGDIRRGVQMAERIAREQSLNLVHCRSFVPGNVGLALARRLKIPFLYDMRGFWAEEKWAKGTIRWQAVKKVAQRMEDRLFFNADALVSLTDAGRKILVDRGVTAPIEVIPCCADTDKFTWNGRSRKSVLRVVSLGSLGPGYCPEGVVGVFAAIKKLWPAATLRLVTRTDPAPIYYLATNAGVDRASIEVVSVHPEEVPRCLADADVGLCMIEPSFAKIASSPTKLAEYLASGIPVIANCEGIGDLGRIFGNDRVGVDLTSFDESGYTAAAARLGDLLADPLLSERCRAVACQSMSLESGVEKYWNLYQTCVRPRKLAEV